MTSFGFDSGPLSERLIELSDRVSRNSKLLLQPGFVPTDEFREEQRRLMAECEQLRDELKRMRQTRNGHDAAPNGTS